MSELTERPDLMLEVLAKLVHRAGGSVRVTASDEPTGPFDLLSRIDWDGGIVELVLSGKKSA